MNYYDEIKNKLIDNEINKRISDYNRNKKDINTYYDVGKLLVAAQGGLDRAKYGDKIIKEYSIKLTNEIGKGYTASALKRMRQLYLNILKGATMSHQLTWSHYVELLTMNDINIINYYINIVIKNNLSVRELRSRIKGKFVKQ